MAFGVSQILAVELGSSQLRVIHGDVSGNLLRVHDFAVEETLISNPENAVQQLESLLERKRLHSYPAALTLSGPGVAHRQLDFPLMPLDELSLVVEREMRAVGGAGGDEVVFDWEVIEKNDLGNLKLSRVLVAIAPRPQVDGAQQLLAKCHLKPALFTTVPLALLRSLRFVHGEGKGLLAVLHMMGQQGYLLGVKDGAWNFYREFSSRLSEKGEDNLLEEAAKEANRAILYHRQRYREAGEMGFLLSGEKGLDELQKILQRETGFQGEIMRPGPGLDLSPLGARAKIFQDLFPSFIIPLGLIAAVSLPVGINLVPKAARKSVRRRPTIDLSFVRQPLSALVLLLVFFGVHSVIVYMERHYRRVLEDRTALYAQWAPAIQAAEESRALRDTEKLLAQSIGSSRVGETSWVVLFKILSRLAPPDMILQTMSLQRDKDKGAWLVALKGQVVAPDSYSAQAAFNRFYQGLKSYPRFERIELLPLDISTVTEKVENQSIKNAGATPAKAAGQSKVEGVEVKKTKVQFEVRFQSKGI
jgi:Tfp pilus assembly PilM family ATPase